MGAVMPANAAVDEQVSINAGGKVLSGDLSMPRKAVGIVLFVHGSGSSRLSPRNRFVAGELNGKGIATLLFDLLTREEEAVDEETAELRFNIGFLAERLARATEWALRDPRTKGLRLGYFGASAGAAAALVAAAERPDTVRAVVSRGGRPDLAVDSLPRVRCPTLLIVGGLDEEVIALNRQALASLKAEKALVIVPGATHLFEEEGALEEVARHASKWFLEHLGGP